MSTTNDDETRGWDPRTPDERALDVAGALQLHHPTPRPGGFFGGPRIPPEFCSASCSRAACDVSGYIAEPEYHAFDEAGVEYVVLCEEHAAERDEYLEMKAERLARGDEGVRR